MMTPFKLTWKVSKEESDMLLREYLYQKSISKRALTDIKFAGGNIYVNEREENVRYQCKTDDVITLVFPFERISDSLVAEDIPLDIVYEDAYILVVNKPAHMNTIPSRLEPTGSLANGLLGYYKRQHINAGIHIVTRLDKNTSGLVLIAKYRYIHHLFSLMQQERAIHRTYQALVEGVMAETYGTIEAPIARKSSSIIEREVNELGQFARTHYEVLESFHNQTHIQLKLDTGRTHQIRVHMSYIGYPLLGDTLYGAEEIAENRHILHSSNITFQHPITNQQIELSSLVPF